MSSLNRDVISVIVRYLDHDSCSELFHYLRNKQLRHLSMAVLESELLKLHKESQDVKRKLKRITGEVDEIDKSLKAIQ